MEFTGPLLLACGLVGAGGALVAVWYGARTERQRLVVQVPKDLADSVAATQREFLAVREQLTSDLDHLRREFSGFLEDATGILESVERKRAQAAGRKSRERVTEPVTEPTPMDPELMRESILARARTQGFDD